jgi:protein MpaA
MTSLAIRYSAVAIFAVGVLQGCASEQVSETSPAPQRPAPALAPPAAPALSAAELAAQREQKQKADDAAVIEQFCSQVKGVYERNKWGPSPCSSVPFKILGYSVQKRPLVYFEAGQADSKKLTLIQCAIHGDEIPGLAMCFRLIQEIMDKRKSPPAGHRLIVQPLLNPDGMLAKNPTRHNANGVDINRNFPTKDFAQDALESWKRKDHGDVRKFPGQTANSEPETQSLVRFIEGDKPQKIISIHTPLGFLDLDSIGKPDKVRRAKFLAINMSKNSGNLKFRSFGFFPGSLGNWAGRERQIPVYTLELPPGDASRNTIDHYWNRFRVALWRAIKFDLDTGQFSED